MSRETSELNAIENIYESMADRIAEILGIDEFPIILEELIWKSAEAEFNARGRCE